MPLDIRSEEVNRLAEKVAGSAGVGNSKAVRRAPAGAYERPEESLAASGLGADDASLIERREGAQLLSMSGLWLLDAKLALRRIAVCRS